MGTCVTFQHSAFSIEEMYVPGADAGVKASFKASVKARAPSSCSAASRGARAMMEESDRRQEREGGDECIQRSLQ